MLKSSCPLTACGPKWPMIELRKRRNLIRQNLRANQKGERERRRRSKKQGKREVLNTSHTLSSNLLQSRMSSSTVFFFPSSCLFLRRSRHAEKSSLHSKRRAAAAVRSSSGPTLSETHEEEGGGVLLLLGRRHALASALASSGFFSVFGLAGDCLAVIKQGPLAGRIPGLSDPDEKGWRTYRRPDDKSGGHGVGWSPIIPYTFRVPDGWEEVPVSIADLGGTEIDLRFASSKEGRLFVIVAPVRRFADLDDATIEEIGPPDRVIDAFGPEVVGENVEGKVLATETAEHSGRTYYQFELESPHALITATAAGNRLYLFNVTGSGLQWKRHYNDLKQIANSFRVV